MTWFYKSMDPNNKKQNSQQCKNNIVNLCK